MCTHTRRLYVVPDNVIPDITLPASPENLDMKFFGSTPDQLNQSVCERRLTSAHEQALQRILIDDKV